MVIGKGKASRGKTGSEAKSGLSEKAGLTLSVPRTMKFIRKQRVSGRCGKSAMVFLTGAIEYICGEILEVSSMKTQEAKKNTISNRHLYLGIKTDTELRALFMKSGSAIRNAGFQTDNALPISKKASKTQKKE